MQNIHMKYVNLVIDNRSDSTDRFYTYACSDDTISIGNKVYVPFARGSKLREAYVADIVDSVDSKLAEKLRYIDSIDRDVSLNEEMMRTALWMKGRYLCRYIDAVRCFLPAGKKAVRRAVTDTLRDEKGESLHINELTEQQQNALDKIGKAIERGVYDSFLIHGVTGSGKTEIYMRAAEQAIAEGKSVIVLVPEISLTGQITDRFIGKFGADAIAVLHSRLTLGERYDQWQKIRRGEVKIAIGARSAVFAPFVNTGLIIVDEEHEATYKSDHTPKYDTIEVALKRVRDKDSNGVLLLGSATPSVVTYSRGREGIYKIIELTERYNKVSLPDVKVVDMRGELKNGNRSIISRELYEQMNVNLKSGRQIMLLLNRRGYYTFISCRECGYVAVCPVCGVSLTYHKSEGKAVCHYCGYEKEAMTSCPECGSRYIKYFGSGTEQLEETIAQLFSEYRAERLDFDSVKKKGELRRKLGEFRKGKIDILIGTQLIAKGLDFKNVGLVGIVSADVSLNIPDFRSAERTFQLITQAAGRAGRGEQSGSVVIQTYSPEHYAIKYAAAQDYNGFYETESELRKLLKNPPYSDLFQVIFSGKDETAVREGAQLWYESLLALIDVSEKKNLFKPQAAYMSKINDTYRYSMLIRCPKGKRNIYSSMLAKIKTEENKKRKRGYNAVIDINPYSFT